MTDYAKLTMQWLGEFAAQGVFSTDSQLTIQSWNPWLQTHSGYSAADVLGRNLLEVFPDLTRRGLHKFYERALAGANQILSHRFHSYLLPIPSQIESGSALMQQRAMIAPLYVNQQVVGTITVIEDVTERVLRERELKGELAFQELLSEVNKAVLTLDLDDCLGSVIDRILRFNPHNSVSILVRNGEGATLRGFKGAGGAIESFAIEAGSHAASAAMDCKGPLFIDDLKTQSSEHSIAPLDSASRSLIAVPLVVDDAAIGAIVLESARESAFGEWEKRLLAAVSVQVAIAIRNARMHAALAESEVRYRLVTEQSLVGVALIQSDRFIYANPALGQIFGYSPRVMMDQLKPIDLVHPDHREMIAENLRRRLSGEQPEARYQFLGLHQNGSTLHIEVYSKRTLHNGRPAVLASMVDISEQVRAQEEHARLYAAIEQAGEGVLMCDPDWQIRYVNPAFERLSGYTREELVGRHARFLKSAKHGDVFYREILEKLQTTGSWFGRFSSRRKDGSECEIEATISCVRNAEGRTINFVSVERDITELLRTEAKLRQVQKMEAIGTLSGGIAHDFNNILGIIMGNAELIQMETPETSPAAQYVRQVILAARRAADLVKQILLFSRERKAQSGPVSMSSIVNEALKLLRPLLPSTIQIKPRMKVSAVEGGGTIIADPTQIHQVLMNLCTNAAYAMREEGGLLEVTVDEVRVDEQFALNTPGGKAGDYLRLIVRDNGEGMDSHTLERAFDPYFTTKPFGQGSGLGLSVVHGIVKAHGGFIQVQSEVGKGSEFSVYFPRANGRLQEQKELLEPVLRGSERILLVEDEATLATMFEKMLSFLGYQVVTKLDSTEALRLFQESPNQFDLVLTDHTMPHLTGAKMAVEMLKIRPDMPIVLCTGHSDGIDREKARELGIRGFLMKPVMLRPLSVALRQALND